MSEILPGAVTAELHPYGSQSLIVGSPAVTTLGTKPIPKNLAKKLAAVMAAVGRVPKRGFNAFHKYYYVMESDLADAIRDQLSKVGMVLLPHVVRVETVGTRQTRSGGEETQVRAWVEYTFIDSESGESWATTMPGDGADSGDKAIYKAITGSGKYLLLKAFWIPTGDDPEKDDSKTDGGSTIVDPKPFGDPPRKATPAADAQAVFPGATVVEDRISPPQVERLQTIARKAGHKGPAVKAWLAKDYGVESSKDLRPSDYDAVCKRLERKEPL